MPADTRSTSKAKHDDAGRQKEKKQESSSPSSTRKSMRLNGGNCESSTPSPLRRSDRVGKSDKSLSSTGTTHMSHKRKKLDNELLVEANQGDQCGKPDSNTSSKKKKTLTAHRYRELFKSYKKPKTSVGPCTSCNSGGGSKQVSVAGEDDMNEERKCGDVYAESTSKGDQDGSDSALKGVDSEIPNEQNNVERHPGQKPLNPPVEDLEVSVRCSKRQRIDDGGLTEKFCSDNTDLLQDACENLIQEVCSEGENGDVIIAGKDLQLDAQMGCEENKCMICKLAGRLLYCGGKGCGRRCHPACLNSVWEDIYPGTWHCPWCTKKKIESGVHSVSEGIESILDVRVENIQHCEGTKRQTKYFVKYKGLAHTYNSWLPEQQLLQEAPELVAEFVPRETAINWRQEWAVPHRLLQKRSLMLPKYVGCVAQEAGGLNCQHEWLVKWCGLDYNESTWELENSVLLKTPKAFDLMNEYEARHEKARRGLLLQEVDKIHEKNMDDSIKLSTLPSGYDTSCAIFINKLCDHWTKGRNVLIIDEQVQAAHIIYFILTVQPNASQPFLIVVPSSSISKWEAELSLLAPSINTVAYNGSRDARKIIRTLEFYEDGPRVMFEVLLSTLEIITEDMEFIKCIRWEAVIMDVCHKSETLAESFFLKELNSGSMILLLIDQIHDNVIDYRNILSLLKHGHDLRDVEDHQVDSSSLPLLREKLSPFIVHGPKSGSSRLVEYWIPVQMSNMQLEQYCSILLTSLTALCSKIDPVGFLPEILISTRKCCDHPCVIDISLQGQFPPELLFDMGVKASGKLHFLDAMLTKMKDQGKKAVILYKSLGGSGTLGDILEDYVFQRFGKDSYERVEGGGMPSRRQASLTKFNKEERRFILLLETRACSSSIKLSSVDAVFIFGSDWNPLSDLKAVQKIKIDSPLEVNVFRLYTSCTIEERVLLLSKKNIVLESTLQGIGLSTSHTLLTWGASYLFKKLDEFHGGAGCPEIFPQDSVLKDVVQEFMSLIQKHRTRAPNKFISSAWHKVGGYSTDLSLFGERYNHLKDEDQHRNFWSKLLEGRYPTWTYLPVPSPRNRKRVQYYPKSSESDVHTDEVTRRQKKIGNTVVEPCSPRVSKDTEKEPASGLFGTSPKNGPELSPKLGSRITSAQKTDIAISSDTLRDEQKNLHQILKPDVEKLFQILGLKEDVQEMAERFLGHVITNDRVIREPDTMLQAFQISVCWIAASILKEKLDHVDSLSLARKHLNFSCTVDDAEFVYSKMQFSMKMFLRSEGANLQASSKYFVSQTEGLASETMRDNVRESTLSMQQKEKVTEECLVQGFNKLVLAPIQTDEQDEKVISKYMKRIEKNLKKQVEKQLNEGEELHKLWQKTKAKLEKKFKLEAAVIHYIKSSEAVRTDKLKILEDNHKQTLDQLDSDMAARLEDMKVRHQTEREEEEREGIRELEELYNNLQSSKEAFEEENTNVPSADDVQVPMSRTPEAHTDAEDCGSAEVAGVPVAGDRILSNDSRKKSPSATRVDNEDLTFANDPLDGIHVSSAVAIDAGELIATSKNDLLSAENPTLQAGADASEEGTARMDQRDEANSSSHINSMNSPSTTNPSVIQPVTNELQVDYVSGFQEPAPSCTGLNQLNNQHVYNETSGMHSRVIEDTMPSSNRSDGLPCNTSDQAVNSLPPGPAVILPTVISLREDLTQSCSRTPEVPIPEDQRPSNRSVEASPRPSFIPPLQNSSQFEHHMASRSLPRPLSASRAFQESGKELDPLQREYDRIHGESIQVSKIHEELVSRLKLDCDKEIEEIVTQIRRRYDSKRQEAETLFMQKKNELDYIQSKVLMNMALAEAFRCKCIDHRAAPGAQQVPSSLTQQLLQSQFTRRAASPARVGPQIATAPPPPPQIVNRSTGHPSIMLAVPPQGSSAPSGSWAGGSQLRFPPLTRDSFNPSIPMASTSVQAIATMSQPPNGTISRPPLLQQPQPQIYLGGASHGDGPRVAENFARPTPFLHTSSSATDLVMNVTPDQNAARSAAALSQLPDIARNFDTFDSLMSEFETSLDAGQPVGPCRTNEAATGFVCLLDDE